MEDKLQGRQPQQKTTFNNWVLAKLALKHLKVKSHRAQNNCQLTFQIFEKMEDDLQGR